MEVVDKHVLQYQQFSFRYGHETESYAVEDISFDLHKGKVLLITGPGGAGKTTLCRAANGLIPQEFKGKMSGKVIVDGHYSTRKYGVSELSKRVGLLQQNPDLQLFLPSVEEEIVFGACNYGIPAEDIRKHVEQLLALTHLTPFRQKNPHKLSGGQKQSCALAAILSFEPDILILDEPTSDLDPLGGRDILHLITRLSREEEHTTLLVEHKIEELVHLVDEMIVIDKGKILYRGSVREVLEHVELIDSLGLSTPQVTLLAARLCSAGWQIEHLPIDLPEAITALTPLAVQSKLAELPIPQTQLCPSADAEVIIDIHHLTHIYNDGTTALSNIDLQICRGEFVAVLGQNGSGKTTLVKHLNGLLKPTIGSVTVNGVHTHKTPIHQMARSVGYIFQNPDLQICKLKVYDELAFGLKNIGLSPTEIDARVQEVAQTLDMSHLLDKNPFALSMGEKQRIAVASVLIMQTAILVLDEPTTGQDSRSVKNIMDMAARLHQQGKTILVITHDMNLAAQYCKRVIVLSKGQKVLDAPTHTGFLADEILKQSSLCAPQITQLGLSLGYQGTWLTVDDAFAALNRVPIEV